MNIEQIQDDITRSNFGDTNDLIPPYNEEDEEEHKLNATDLALRRSISLKNRLITLVNAYYLGKIMTQAEKEEVVKYRKKVTAHYLRRATKTFDLFEQCPTQILLTKDLTIERIALLKRSEITLLRQQMLEFFVGTQTLEEENC